MATGFIPLRDVGGATTPASWAQEAFGACWKFDDTTPEMARLGGVIPDNFDPATAPDLLVYYSMASATSGKLDMEAAAIIISADDPTDIDLAAADAVNAANETVPGTVGYPGLLTIPMTNFQNVNTGGADEDAAAGDLFVIEVERDADDGTDDTATGDAEVRAVVLRYTVA